MSRLIYDTTAGNLDERGTFAQLVEYLRKAEEDAQAMCRHAKIKGDDHRAAGWLQMATNFHKCSLIVAKLATSRTTTGLGYGRPN